MRNKFILFLLFLFTGCSTSSGPEFENNMKPAFINSEQEEVFNAMSQVYNWQNNHFPQHKYSPNWQAATFFIGAMAAFEQTEFKRFLKRPYCWAEDNDWKLGDRKFHADDQASAQVYIKLYDLYGESYMIEDFASEVNEMIDLKPHLNEPIIWWWADALFMAPPALAHLAIITGEDKYLTFMHKSWHETYIHLYNKKDSLFVRDRVNGHDVNSEGKQMYWLRGNGWVVAGLARLIDFMPDKASDMKAEYEQLFKQMIAKLIDLQQDDGLWRSDLLYPGKYPTPETSGSAFICYAIAWGINQNLLEGSEYEEAMLKSWKGLSDKINDDGKLGNVQSVGARPENVNRENSELFGSGAFLLAASEMYRFFANS